MCIVLRFHGGFVRKKYKDVDNATLISFAELEINSQAID
jgi:hypothetical protein